MGITVNEMFPGRYFKADDFVQDRAFIIERIVQEDVGGQGNPIDQKWVMYFQGETQGLVLNVTNARALERIHGEDSGSWCGKQITLGRELTSMAGQSLYGTRVRIPPQAPSPSTEATPQQTEPPGNGSSESVTM